MGPFWDHLDPFWSFHTKLDFLPRKHKVLLGQSDLEQKLKFCVKWPKRVQIGPKWPQMVMHFFVRIHICSNTHFCRESKIVANLHSKTQIINQTNTTWLRLYTDYPNKKLVGGVLSSTSRVTPAQFQMIKLQKDLKLRSIFNTKNYQRGRNIQVKTLKRLKVNEAVLMRLWESIVCRLGVAERQDHKAAYQRCLAR